MVWSSSTYVVFREVPLAYAWCALYPRASWRERQDDRACPLSACHRSSEVPPLVSVVAVPVLQAICFIQIPPRVQWPTPNCILYIVFIYLIHIRNIVGASVNRNNTIIIKCLVGAHIMQNNIIIYVISKFRVNFFWVTFFDPLPSTTHSRVANKS